MARHAWCSAPSPAWLVEWLYPIPHQLPTTSWATPARPLGSWLHAAPSPRNACLTAPAAPSPLPADGPQPTGDSRASQTPPWSAWLPIAPTLASSSSSRHLPPSPPRCWARRARCSQARAGPHPPSWAHHARTTCWLAARAPPRGQAPWTPRPAAAPPRHAAAGWEPAAAATAATARLPPARHGAGRYGAWHARLSTSLAAPRAPRARHAAPTSPHGSHAPPGHAARTTSLHARPATSPHDDARPWAAAWHGPWCAHVRGTHAA